MLVNKLLTNILRAIKMNDISMTAKQYRLLPIGHIEQLNVIFMAFYNFIE